MFTICCTQKLFKRTGLPAEPLLANPTNALGNWYADLLFVSRLQLLLFVNENSRLAIITPAKEARSLASHLSQHLAEFLQKMKVPQEWIEAELREMHEARFSKTNSRSVLGTMNDYRSQIEWFIYDKGEASPLILSMQLRDCPCGPLKYASPFVLTFEFLKDRYGHSL